MDLDSDEPWSKSDTRLLLHILKKYYHSYQEPTERHEALQQIYTELKEAKVNVKLETIKKKIRTLRSQLYQEGRYARDCLRRGIPYAPKLWCYDELQFMQLEDNNAASLHSLKTDNSKKVKEFNYIEGVRSSIKQLNYNISLQAASLPENNTENYDEEMVEDEVTTDEVPAARNDLVRECLRMPESMATNTKDELFCEFLCTELEQLRCEEIFDKAKLQLLELVTKLKNEDRRIYQQQQHKLYNN